MDAGSGLPARDDPVNTGHPTSGVSGKREDDVVAVPTVAQGATGPDESRLTAFVKAYDVRGLVGSQLTTDVTRAIGYAFAVQELPAVPTDPHDERLDAIATDAGIVRPVEE